MKSKNATRIKMNEDENFQALSDLMSAMLFVFIITLIAYIINFSSNRDLAQSIGQQMSDLELKKSYIIRNISDNLGRNNIRHSVDLKKGIISISSDQLGFKAGLHQLGSTSLKSMLKVSTSISEELICAKENATNLSSCIDGFIPEIDYVYIEGHTDNVPFRSRNGIRDNIDLSLLRAASVKRVMDELVSTKNSKVFIPVGYGSTKPIIFHPKPTDDSKNRRIDFRFSLKKPWEHSS